MTGVTTIITCMTEAERPFVADTIRSAQRQTGPTHIILCVAEDNEWIDDILASVEPGVELLRLERAWARGGQEPRDRTVTNRVRRFPRR